MIHKNPDPAGVVFNDDVLHIYSPWVWHADAKIIGTRYAMQKLRDAIDDAIHGSRKVIQSFVNDGEGFDLLVECVDDEVADNLDPPYTDEECFPRTKQHSSTGGDSKEKT